MRRLALMLFAGLLCAGGVPPVKAADDNTDFDRSPLGNKGLEIWLQSKGMPVTRVDKAGGTPGDSAVSLRVVFIPAPPAAPAPGAVVREADPFEPLPDPNGAPTLFVMPKWRADVLQYGTSDIHAIVPSAEITKALGKIGLPYIYVEDLGPKFHAAQQAILPGHVEKISIFRPQVFFRNKVPPNCIEMAGLKAGALLLKCQLDHLVYVLSDPDLLNNHGLALGENAAFAVSLINELRGAHATKPVYLTALDRPPAAASPVPALAPPPKPTASSQGRQGHEPHPADQTGLLAYPLSVIWGAIILVAAICFWRGAHRFGPALKEAASHEVSKPAAIEATARLLRLSGNDGRLTSQFVEALLCDRAALLFGPAAANEAGVERMFQRLALRDHASAEALRSVSSKIIERGSAMTPTDLHRHLENFRKLLGSTELGTR